LRWVFDFFGAMHPFDVGEVYVNSLDEGEGHRIRKAYGGNYDRLATLKAKFDPTNFFRCNQNISPL
jgi:FAD/FMN-containing dehydrogenase